MPVLDTDFVIDLLHDRAGAAAALETYLAGARPLAVSAATVQQLYFGVPLARLPDREEALVEAALAGMATLPVTRDIAVRAGRVEGALAARGRPIGPADAVIAATALHHREAVVTRNVRHFRDIPGLTVETY